MGMATPEPSRTSFTATFAVDPADRREGLTCFLCWGPRVDWHTTMRLNGRVMTVGVHEVCAAKLEAAAPQPTDPPACQCSCVECGCDSGARCSRPPADGHGAHLCAACMVAEADRIIATTQPTDPEAK